MRLCPSVRAFVCLLLVAAVWALSGCALTQPPSAQDVGAALAQLKDDTATVCISVIGPAGTVTAMRTNQPGSVVKPGCDISQGSPQGK